MLHGPSSGVHDVSAADDTPGTARTRSANSERNDERFAAYRRHEDALRAHFDAVLNEPIPVRLTERRRARPASLLRYVAVIGWLALGGETACNIDRVAPQVINELLGPYHSGNHRAGGDSDAQLARWPSYGRDRSRLSKIAADRHSIDVRSWQCHYAETCLL